MPLYTFRCDNGHHVHLHRDSADAAKPVYCPDCGAPARRLLKLRTVDPGPSFRED